MSTRIKQLFFVIIVICFIGAGSPAKYQADDSHSIDLSSEVISAGFFNWFDLLLDSGGNAHVVAAEAVLDELYYSNNMGGSWQTPEYIHYVSDSGTETVTMDFDSAEKIHVAFNEGPGYRLTYTNNAGSSWATESVRSTSRWPSMAVHADKPHVAYYFDSNGLNYSVKEPTGWTHENVDNSGGATTYAGRYPSLQMDTLGKAHIAYYDYSTHTLKYATNASGLWDIDTVASDVYSSGVLDLDSSNYPHIVYEKSGDLFYGYKTPTGWEEEHITSGGVRGAGDWRGVDIEIHPTGIPVILYLKPCSYWLAVRMPSGWKHYLIYRGLRGELAGAALELRGNKAHIVISDQDKEQLIYLTGRPFPQELTHINLCGPRDTGYVESPPTFCWTPNGVGNNYYAVEISFTPDFANYYSSFEDLGQFITSTSWTMPYLYYSMLPIGVPVYWRVRGKDLDHSPQTIIASDEVWWFYKEF